MRRRHVVAAAFLVGTGGAAALYWNVFLPRRLDGELAAAREETSRRGAIVVSRSPERRLDAPAPAGITAFTFTGEARDGVAAFGKLWVASSGGVLVFGESGRHERTLTWLDGLGSADATAMARWGRFVAVGGADGSVSLLDGERVQTLRFAVEPAAAVTALASDGPRLYVATAGAGLLSWDGQRGERVRLADGGALPASITALAIADGRLAVGAADGRVFLSRGGGLEGFGPPLPGERGAVTALVFRGDDLLVGRPFGLDRLDAQGRLTAIQTDVFVTSLALDPESRLWLGSFDAGARREDAAATTKDRVFAVRWIDGRPLAFTVGGVRDLAANRPAVAWPASPLPGAMVTALAEHAGSLWVGTFRDGLARFALDGQPQPPPVSEDGYGLTQINGFERGPDTLVAATARGILRFDAAGRVTRAAADELVSATAGSAYTTNRGVTIGERSLGAAFGLANGHATAVAWLGDRLYVGTLGGLSILVTRGAPRVERNLIAAPGQLPAAWVTALVPTTGGMLVGTYGGGVVLVRADGRVDRLTDAVRVNPGALVVDGGRALVGTLDHGLVSIDLARQQASPLELPLGTRNVTALSVGADALWIGTEQGLLRVAAARVRS